MNDQSYFYRIENQNRKEEFKKGLKYYYDNTNNNLEKETNND